MYETPSVCSRSLTFTLVLHWCRSCSIGHVLAMDFVSVLLVLAPLLTICLFILALLKQRQTGDTTGETDDAGRGDGQVVQPARRAAVVRNRGRARMAGGVDADGDDDEEPSAVAPSDGKIGAKKMAKLQAKAEKKTQRESEQREREERKQRSEQEAAEARQREQEADQLEQAQAEAERLAREERERREHDEYLKMREAFGVEEEGYDEQMEQEQENLLQQFINHIKRVKVVLLEDLAAQFKLKTQDAIDRLQTLMQEGKLTGVIDDRGKFIYIPHSELEAVATFVRRRGRVSLTDLVESSNSLISLLPEVST